MVTEKKAAANARNAARSTGPRTSGGKSRAKLNAVAHGLRALSPVLPGERPEDWDAHRGGVAAALAPVGTLEAELAYRVALLTWRLRRVAGYETALTTAEQDAAAARARRPKSSDPFAALLPAPFAGDAQAVNRDAARHRFTMAAESREEFGRLLTAPPDGPLDGRVACELLREIAGCVHGHGAGGVDTKAPEFLAAAGVPGEWHDEPELWTGWTRRAVVVGMRDIAAGTGLSAPELIERAARGAAEAAEAAEAERAARAGALLPSAAVLDKVMRYEAHLNKQLVQTLHLLERLQAARGGNPPVPPAALDVTIETGVITLPAPR